MSRALMMADLVQSRYLQIRDDVAMSHKVQPDRARQSIPSLSLLTWMGRLLASTGVRLFHQQNPLQN